MTTPTPSRRGGKRPGAGAPRGNQNAAIHGRRSRHATAALRHLPPATRELVAVADLWRREGILRDHPEAATVRTLRPWLDGLEIAAAGLPLEDHFAIGPRPPAAAQSRDARTHAAPPAHQQSSLQAPEKAPR